MNIIKPFQPAKSIVPTVRSISTLSGDIQGDFPELRDGELTYRQDPAAAELLLMLLESLKQFRAQSGGSISISNSTSVIRNNICSIVNNFRSAAVGTAGLELLLKKIGEVFSSEAPEAPSPQSAELLIKQLSGQIEKMGISPKDHAAMVSELRGGISGADMERAAGNTLKKNSELTARLYSGKIHIHRLFDRSGGMNGIYSTYSTYSTYGVSVTSGMNSAGGGRSGAAVGIIGSAEIGGDSLKRFFGGFKAMLPRGGQTEQIEAASADTAVPAFTSMTSIAAITAKGADHSAGNKVFSNRSRVLRGTQESTVWERNGSISRGGKGGCKRLTELVLSNRFSGSETPDTGRKNTAADIPAGSGAAHSDVRSYPESDAGSIPPVTDHSGKSTAYGLFTRLSDKLSAQIFTKLSAQLSGEPRGEITGITGAAGAAPAAVPAVFNLYAAYSSNFAYVSVFAREMRERFRNTPAASYEGLGRVKENTLSYFRSFVKNTKWYYDRSNKSTSLRRGHSAAEIPPVSGGAVMTSSDPVGAGRSETPVIPETSEIRKSHESRERYEIREIIRDQEKPSFVMAEFTRNYAPELFGGLLTEKTAFRLSVPENLGGEKRSVSGVSRVSGISGISSISSELIYLNRYSIPSVGNKEDGSPDTRRSGITDNKADRLKPDHFAGAENADNMGSARSERIFKFDKSEISSGSAEFTAYSGNAGKPEATNRMKADGKHVGSISAAEPYRFLVLKENPAAGELFRYRGAYPAGLSAAFTDIYKTLRSNVSSGLKVSGGSARLARLAHTAGLARVQNNLYNLNNPHNPGDPIGSILPGAKLLNNNSVRSIVFSRFSNFPHFTHFPRFSHFSLMQSSSGQSKAGHSAFSLAARDSMTWPTDQTARITPTALTARTSPTVRTAQTAPTAPTAPTTPTALNKSNVSSKVSVLNVPNVSNASNVSNVLNEMNKLTARAALVLHSEIRGRLSERIAFSEKAEMLNIRSVAEISGYSPEYAVNDFSLPGSDRRGTLLFPRLTDISGTPVFNEPGYSARHTESAPAGHEEYDRAVGAGQRKWEYLRSVRAEYIKIVRAQNSLNRKTFLSPERYRAAFPGNVGEIAAAAANKSNKVNKANIADAALQAIEANRYIGGNIYRIPARGNESFPERAAAPAVYKPESAGAGASPEKPVYPAIASVSGAFPISLKGFARRLILMERSRSGDTESLITVNTPRKSSLLERFPGGGAYLDAGYADRKIGISVRNGTNGASGIIEQNPDVYRSSDTVRGSSAGGENTLYYYSAAVPEKSGGNAQELPADRDIPDKGDKGTEVSNEVPLPPAERIYSQLNISERVSALLSSEEAMKRYIMNQINSYFSENNAHNVNSLIQNQYNSADMLCEQVISRLERRLKTERRINGR